jgi:DNA-binding transcriptional LysR family regulator
MELASNEAIKHAVAAGLGVSVLSRHALDVEPHFDGLAILDVEGFPLADDWFFVYPRGRRLSAVAKAFFDHVVAETTKLKRMPAGLPSTARIQPHR